MNLFFLITKEISQMIYLLLSIFVSTVVFVVFKLIGQNKGSIFHVIIINYVAAAITGYVLAPQAIKTLFNEFSPYGIILVLITGILFIVMFYLIGLTTRHTGIVVTSIASKMSVIFPITLSIIIDTNDHPDFYTFSAILLTLIAVFFTIYRKQSEKKTESRYYYLPILLFTGMGLVDSLVKYAQYNYITDNNLLAFSTALFTVSAITCILLSVIKKVELKKLLKGKVVLAGILLGLANLGSVYFLVKTLNLNKDNNLFLESSSVFALNNMGIVLLSAITGFLFFKEKMTLINVAGIIMSLLAIYLLSK